MCVRGGVSVSTPLVWDEVDGKLSPAMFTMRNVFKRVEKYGDLFEGVEMERVLEKIEAVGLSR